MLYSISNPSCPHTTLRDVITQKTTNNDVPVDGRHAKLIAPSTATPVIYDSHLRSPDWSHHTAGNM